MPSSAETLYPQGFNELRTKTTSGVSRRLHLRDKNYKIIQSSIKNETLKINVSEIDVIIHISHYMNLKC
jgi:hypothetical protein